MAILVRNGSGSGRLLMRVVDTASLTMVGILPFAAIFGFCLLTAGLIVAAVALLIAVALSLVGGWITVR